MRRIALLCLMACVCLPLRAQTSPEPGPAKTLAQALVDAAVARHPELLEVDVHAKPPGSAQSVIIAAKSASRVGHVSDPDDLQVAKTGHSRVEINRFGDYNVEIELPLYDDQHRTIGSIEMTFPYVAGFDQDALIRKAAGIRNELSAKIPAVAALMEPAPAGTTLAEVPAAGNPIEEYNKQELGNEQTLPMTKAVVSGQALEETIQEGYAEAIRNVAGVAPANSKGSPNDSVYIRGIKLNLFSNYRLNGGLPIAGVITTPNEDKERIEALKGANALMFGVASPAGIINEVTKRAGEHDVTQLGMAANGFGQYGWSADIGRRVLSDKSLGLRANLSDTHLENGVHDLGGHGTFESLGLDWRATDRLSFQGDFEHYSKRLPEQAGISLLPAVNGVVPLTPVPRPRNLLSGTWAIYNPETTNWQVRGDYQIAEGWKVLAEEGRSDSNRSRFTTRISKYNRTTGAGGVVTVQPVSNDYANTFERFELIGKFSTWIFKHDLTIGPSITERDANTTNQNNVTLPQTQNIFNPITLAPPVFTRPFTSLPEQSSKDTAFYAYDTIGVFSKLRLLAGIRRTRDDEQTGPQRTVTEVNTPAYGVLFDILPTTTLFASYMQGLEAGATAPANAANLNVILPSAVSRQREIGIRDSYFKGLSISSSFFRITRANAVTDPVTNIFENNGDLLYKGVESTFTWDINRHWTVNGAAQWLSAVQNSPLQPLINGLVPENTPKWLGNLSVTYRPARIEGLAITVGSSGVTSRPINPQDQGSIPGYFLYTASAGYATRISGYRASFQLNVDNLGNLHYWNSVQTGTYGTGMDRTFKVSAKVDF
ncbi:MAG TPA: TonB-dependent receptor plug domain-containing protein [Burkholderiaceae bacterium]|nr:TonB-dependent receptor plug domain-containing protein [Burkholderiaceae bacterium]